LSRVALGDENVVKHLIHLIQTSKNGLLLTEAPRALSKLLQGDLFSVAVRGLKDYLQNEVYKTDPGRYEQIYQILWFCTRKMSYPDFYQAWHETTTHQQG
jgi:HEAT repeat protein